MKFFRFSLLSAVLCSGASIAHAASAPGAPGFVSGEVLVRTSPASAAAIRKFAAASGGRSVRTYPLTGWQRIKLPAGTNVETAVASFAKQSGVLAAEPNYTVKVQKTSNDKLYSSLYGLAKIGAPAAWNVTQGSNDVVVAVCDTGVKYNHPDLAANMWKNPGEIANNGKDDDGNGIVDDVYGIDAANDDGDPIDDNGHGTHCAGVIGAVGNNSIGVVGVNWKVKIMALKFLSSLGSGANSDAVEAYEYAIAQKKRGVNLRVISNSWGGIGKSEAIRSVMETAANNGIISICAAGNDDTNTDSKFFSPANENVTGLVSVGASDDQDNPASFSNYGHKNVDLYAPGVNILSTWIGSGDDAYTYEDGTSMACPHVAGAAALLLAQAPSLTPVQVKARLMASVDKLASLKGLAVTEGRLNLAKLLSGSIFSVRGTVYDNAKKPLAGAQIFVNGSSKVVGTSDVKGAYSVDGLAAGTYTLTAKLKGWKFTPTPTQVTLGTGGYIGKVDFTGKAQSSVYSVTGSVYKLNGTKKTPLKGARIFIGDAALPVAVTDASGKYTINGLAAGTYFLFARLNEYDVRAADQLTLDGSAKVVLPAKKPATAVADFVYDVTDLTPPVVTVYAPYHDILTNPSIDYDLGEFKKAYGTAYDASGVDYIDFVLKRIVSNGTVNFYNWTTKTWSAASTNDQGYFFLVPDTALLRQEFDSPTVSWSVDLPDLEPGTYGFEAFSADKLGNTTPYSYVSQFVVGPDVSTKSFPLVTITAPTTAKNVLADTVTNAKGTASDVNGVDTVYVYLRRYDEFTRDLSYYDWVAKTWVSPTAFTLDCYTEVSAGGATNFTWNVKLPKLAAGNYEVGAFARDDDGNEPLEDGTQDVLSPFTVEPSVGTSAAKAATSASSS